MIVATTVFCQIPHLRIHVHVQSIFTSLQSFDVENFISFWDFLNKRFFFHLDSEHLNLSGVLKTDLIKYYLIYCIKTKNKDKVTEFFSSYSHEILAEAGTFIPGNLRGWFVLPYMDEPDKDGEFSAYFAQRWSDLLKVTLHNFLSVVLSSAPPPKLLLLEKWFRSEAQQEIRSQLKQSAKKIDSLIVRIEQQEERLQSLRETVKILATLLYQAVTNANGAMGSSQSRINNNNSAENEAEVEAKRNKAKSFGLEVARIATDCLKKSTTLQGLPREERLVALLGNVCSTVVFNASSSGAGWPSYYDNAVQEDGRGDSLAVTSGRAVEKGSLVDIDLETLEGELVRTVQDWSSILS